MPELNSNLQQQFEVELKGRATILEKVKPVTSSYTSLKASIGQSGC